MEVLIIIVVFIAILTVLVLVHEWGHFIVARKNGILVEEFGIGFPPRIWGKKRGETLYSINLIPIGGFVKLYGEEYHEEDGVKVDPRLKSRAFVNKKPWQKASVIVAGVVMNFILAWILISYLFTQGVPTPTHNVIVDDVKTDTTELIALSKKFGGKDVVFNIKRQGAIKHITVVPRLNPPAGEGPLGIVITSYIEKKYPWYEAPFYGLVHSFQITQQIVVELGKMLVSLVSFQKTKVDIAGPIGIAKITGQAIKFGNNAVLELMALLSLNLAVVNILPFPALDGGRLVFVIYEWVTKRRANSKVEQYTNIFGMVVLLSLMAMVSTGEVIKLITDLIKR
ncbi:site-2 protease family protein [Candidatus Microgenomates bacterium]|nr:site-2 protease family protein [Candidatus Microgenomates bacterium]